jgi:carbonic anhydrase
MSVYQRPTPMPARPPTSVTIEEAFELLREGNARFVRGLQSMESRKSVHHVRQLAEEGQTPFAIFVSCSDSRVPIEIIFDRGLGDLFSIRLAGNIAPTSALASIEYAALNLRSPLCVVMGHTSCGAIKAAYDAVVNHTGDAPSPHLADLVERITPSVLTATHGKHKQSVDERALLYKATLENVRKTVAEIQSSSTVIRNLVQSRQFAVAGAMYDVHTGKVTFDDNGMSTGNGD